MPDVRLLDVLLGGRHIATLTHIEGDRTVFSFSDSYVADEQRPVLGLTFKDAYGSLRTDFRPTRTRLLPWFSNLLPEGHLRQYLADRARVSAEREFFLLWALGRDLPGAVSVRAPEGLDPYPDSVGRRDSPTDLARVRALRFSLAGIQLKFSALAGAGGGLTIPASGEGGDWIVKLPSSRFDGVPESEFSMLMLARDVGIDVPPCRLVDVSDIENLPQDAGAIGRQALAVQRFDRPGNDSRIHVEDFAQVFDVYPERKYERASMRQLAHVIGLEARDRDVVEFVRRLVFNALIGNADMHLKNWALIYRDGLRAELAPAYDIVPTVAYLPDNAFALRFSRTARFDELTFDELTHLSARARLLEKVVVETAKETVARFHDAWTRESPNLPLAAAVARAIETHVKSVPIARRQA